MIKKKIIHIFVLWALALSFLFFGNEELSSRPIAVAQVCCALRPVANSEAAPALSPDILTLPERIIRDGVLAQDAKRLFGSVDRFVAVLRDPTAIDERREAGASFLAEAGVLAARTLQSVPICGDIPVGDHGDSRVLCERFLEAVALRTGTLEARLADRRLYRTDRADNLGALAVEFGVEPLLVHYLNMRYSGMTILGDNAQLLFTREGKYRKVEGFLADKLFFSTRKVFLGESPYVYSARTGKIYYYGKPLDFGYRAHAFQDESDNWYFKEVWGPNGPTGEVDVRTLVVNFRNFCNKPCAFCWRAYREQTEAVGLQQMALRNLSVDDGLAQIAAAHGVEVFGLIERISVMEAGFPSEELEVDFLVELIEKLKARGFKGKITPFTSFLRSPASFDRLIASGYCMDQCLFPMECFTRRNEVLGERKRCTLEEAFQRMEVSLRYYQDVKAFLLIGLADDLEAIRRHLPEMRARGLGVQLSMYSAVLPRQKDLYSRELVADEKNNGHIRFLLRAARIAFAYGVSCPEGSVVNGIWPAGANSLVHPDSILLMPSEADERDPQEALAQRRETLAKVVATGGFAPIAGFNAVSWWNESNPDGWEGRPLTVARAAGDPVVQSNVIAWTAARSNAAVVSTMMDLTYQQEAILLAMGRPAPLLNYDNGAPQIRGVLAGWMEIDWDQQPVPDVRTSGRIPVYAETVRALKKRFGSPKPVAAFVQGPYSVATGLLGEDALVAPLEQPEKFAAFLRYLNRVNTAIIEYFAESGADIIAFPDPVPTAYLSPKMFVTYSVDQMKAIAAETHKRGLLFLWHPCRPINPGLGERILPDILGGATAAEVDILSLDAAFKMSDVYDRLRQTGNNATVLFGNIDTEHLMPEGPAGAIQDAVTSLDAGMGSRRFLLGTSCDCANVPPAHFQALCSAAQQHSATAGQRLTDQPVEMLTNV